MTALSIFPVQAPVQEGQFDLTTVLVDALKGAKLTLQEGDVVAISSKYVAISEGRVVDLGAVRVSDAAHSLAQRYQMNPAIAQLVLDEAEHIFGGIQLGFALTWRNGVMSPNAGIDRSNVPSGKAVLLPLDGYGTAQELRDALQLAYGVRVGVLLTDSWLVPGRWGTTGVAIACAGFEPLQDERGKQDLFGNPMAVTQRGMADSLCVAAQLVMGERDEATPFAVIRNAPIKLTDRLLGVADVAIPWELCLYVESLTVGLLPDGAPKTAMSSTINLNKREGV
jgi:coenzyme F420-0:L-glutamate ligase